MAKRKLKSNPKMGQPMAVSESDIKVFAKGGKAASTLLKKIKFKRTKVKSVSSAKTGIVKPVPISKTQMAQIKRSQKLSSTLNVKIEKVKRKVSSKRRSSKKGPAAVSLKQIKSNAKFTTKKR